MSNDEINNPDESAIKQTNRELRNPSRLNNGDVVYFKEVKTESRRNGAKTVFKGHGVGILLGHVPPFGKDPDAHMLVRLMAAVGFVKFDDIAEFFGDVVAEEAVKLFTDKYHGKEVPSIVDADGTPIPMTEPTKSAEDVSPENSLTSNDHNEGMN